MSIPTLDDHPFGWLDSYFFQYIENISNYGDISQIKTNAIEWSLLCPIYFYLYSIDELIYCKKNFIKNYKRYQKLKEKDTLLHFPNEFIIHYKDGQKGLGYFYVDKNNVQEDHSENKIETFVCLLYRMILDCEKNNIYLEKFFNNRIPMFTNLLKIINILEKNFNRS